MEQTFNWTISQLERKSDNGFVMIEAIKELKSEIDKLKDK